MHVTVNFLGLFFRTGKIFFGLTRFSCLSVRMTDNFSASFGKSDIPSLVKIHWRMLILECSQGCYTVTNLPSDLDRWPWKSIGFQTLLRTKYVPSLVKIHWRMLILECSQGCYTVTNLPSDLDRWPWKSIGFQTLLRTKYVPSLVKIHWRMLILECSQGCYVVKIWPGDLDLWPTKCMTLKINRVPDSLKD